MTSLLLGVDIGTSAVKVAASVDGEPSQPVAHVAVPWTSTATGAEIDAVLLWQVVLQALREACSAWPDVPVQAVGIASFAESVVLVDPDGTPLAPLVAWHDTTGRQEAALLGAELGGDAFSTRTGLPVSELCSAVKVRAAAAAGLGLPRVGSVLSATDWTVHRLGGSRGFDLSLAARTGWLDLAARGWADDVVAWTGLPGDAMPDVLASGTGRGPASGAGLPATLHGALVVAAGMDHLVAAVGAGAAGPGDVWDSCGTAEAFVRSTTALPAADVLAAVRSGLTVGWHAEAEHQVVLGAQRSGYAFERVLRLLGITTAEELRDLEDAGGQPAGAEGIVFERLYDSAYSVTGLTSTTGAADVWAALVRQVARDGTELLAVADRVAGPHRRIVMGGGWAASRELYGAKQRHHAGIAVTPVEQPGAEGAVLLARRALAGTIAP